MQGGFILHEMVNFLCVGLIFHCKQKLDVIYVLVENNHKS